MTEQELLNKIDVLLGGRTAEEIHFGDVSTGAHNDLSKATDIARSMVKEYGMSKELGQIHFERECKQQSLDGGFFAGRDYGEETAETIDREVKRIIDVQCNIARDILVKYKSVLDKGASFLLKAENMEGKELKKLLEQESR